VLDDLRSYLQMATGLTEATTAKAKEVVSGLLASGMSLSAKAVPAPEMMGQVQELADDLVSTSKNNREMLTGMIRAEVDKAVGRMGFVREDELAALRRHVQRLEAQLTDLETAAAEAAVAHPDVVIEESAAVVVVEHSDDAQPVGEAEVVSAAVEESPVVDEVPKKKKKVIVDPDAGA
jgi:polyhydroxyalkanoate synthesis regulator phasin